MAPDCKEYRKIVGDKVIDKIYEAAGPLVGKHIAHVNTVYYEGGVGSIDE